MPIFEYACPECRRIFQFLSRRLKPVHDRHQRIQQDNVRLPLDEQAHRLLAVFGPDHVVVSQSPHHIGVFDDEHLR